MTKDDNANPGEALARAIEAIIPATAQPSIEQLTAQVGELRTVIQWQVETVAENTRAVLDNTQARAVSSGSNGVSGVAKEVAGKLGSGMVLSPLITGLVGLFTGGSKKQEPPPLVYYSRPERLRMEGEIRRTEGSAPAEEEGLSWGAQSSGEPGVATERWPNSPNAPDRREAPVISAERLPNGSNEPARRETPQITIRVEALDSRSFMDHSEDIARAVRTAMLRSHSLNDLVSEL